MAGPRKGTGQVLLVLGCLLLLVLLAWDMTRPNSFLRGSVGSNPDPANSARSIVEGIRNR